MDTTQTHTHVAVAKKGNSGEVQDSMDGYVVMDGDLSQMERVYWVVNTQYTVQMICCTICTQNPCNFVDQCHPNKFNTKDF